MSFDNAQKQYVRESLWMPIFDRYPGKTLTLPGVQCTFERLLAERGKPLKDFVAVEREVWFIEPILRFLNGEGTLYTGDLSDILAEGKMDSEFPFAVLNLDFCGSPYAVNGNRESKLLSMIETCVRKQQAAGATSFALLLTGRVQFKAPPPVLEPFGSVEEIISSEVFRVVEPILGRAQMRKHLNEVVPEHRDTALALFAIGIQMVDLGHSFGYQVRMPSPPITYTGDGHKSKMIACSFEFFAYPKSGIGLQLKHEQTRDDMLFEVWDRVRNWVSVG